MKVTNIWLFAHASLLKRRTIAVTNSIGRFELDIKRPLDSKTTATTSTRFDLKFFRVLSKIDTPEFFIVLFFTRKVSTVIVIEGGWALSRLQNAKTSNIW